MFTERNNVQFLGIFSLTNFIDAYCAIFAVVVFVPYFALLYCSTLNDAQAQSALLRATYDVGKELFQVQQLVDDHTVIYRNLLLQ